jgi:hypothetical protein
MSPANRVEFGRREAAEQAGYRAAKNCPQELGSPGDASPVASSRWMSSWFSDLLGVTGVVKKAGRALRTKVLLC